MSPSSSFILFFAVIISISSDTLLLAAGQGLDREPKPQQVRRNFKRLSNLVFEQLPASGKSDPVRDGNFEDQAAGQREFVTCAARTIASNVLKWTSLHASDRAEFKRQLESVPCVKRELRKFFPSAAPTVDNPPAGGANNNDFQLEDASSVLDLGEDLDSLDTEGMLEDEELLSNGGLLGSDGAARQNGNNT